MDSNEKAENIAACLRKTSSWKPGERIDVVRRAATKFGKECLPIGLFKYHMDSLIPVIQDADKNPMKWTEGLIQKNFHWSKQMEEVRNFWRGQAGILMNGDSSPLNEETMEVSLAVNAIPLVLEVESSGIKTDLIIDSIVQGFEDKSRGFSRLNDGNLGMVKFHLSDAASTIIDDRALETADYLRRDLFEYHFVALLQDFPGAPGSAEDHYHVARQAWTHHTSAADRLFWSYQTIQVLFRLADGEDEAMAHFDTSQSGHRSEKYAEKALRSLQTMFGRNSPTISEYDPGPWLEQIELPSEANSDQVEDQPMTRRVSSSSLASSNNDTACLCNNKDATPADEWTVINRKATLLVPITQNTPILFSLVGNYVSGVDSSTLADKICDAILRHMRDFPGMRLKGRYRTERINYEPAARDVTSIRFKTENSCLRGPHAAVPAHIPATVEGSIEDLLIPLVNWNTHAFPELRRSTFNAQPWAYNSKTYESALNRLNFRLDCSGLMRETATAKVVHWARSRARKADSKHSLLKSVNEVAANDPMAKALKQWGLAEEESGFVALLESCFECKDLTNEEYEDLIEQKLYGLASAYAIFRN